MKMKKFTKLIVFALVAVLSFSLFSCGAKTNSDYMMESNGTYFDAVEDRVELAPEKSEDGSSSDVLNTTVVQTERKIIYSAWATVQTKEYDDSVAFVKSLCEKYGAYFETSSSYGNSFNYTGERSSKYVIRIPVENYSDFLNEVGEAGSILESGEDNKDVTEQYYDTEARLESAKLREERVLVLLENAKNLDDVLALERELADIRYEIESYTGTMRKLDSLVSYATFTLKLVEVVEYTAPIVPPKTFGEKLAQAFSEGWEDFVYSWQEVALSLTYAVPSMILLAIFALIAFLLIKIVINRKKKKTQPVVASENNEEMQEK